MSAHVPALQLEVDPLIAEAKQRARRRRLLAIGALAVIAAAAVGVTVESRSSESLLGVCGTTQTTWQKRTVDNLALGPRAVVLTNFRFGQVDDFYGLTTPLRWPARGVMVVVMNEGPAATPPFKRALRVGRRDFVGMEGMRFPAAEAAIRSQGRVLEAYVEVGAVTPATLTAANQALAGVHTCSA